MLLTRTTIKMLSQFVLLRGAVGLRLGAINAPRRQLASAFLQYRTVLPLGARLGSSATALRGGLSDDDLFAPAPGSPAASRDVAGESAAAIDAFFGDRVSFESLGIRADLADTLGLAHSTAIQARAAGPILRGDDTVVIAAETGSGKVCKGMCLPIFTTRASCTPHLLF